jgi:hypothetical protein
VSWSKISSGAPAFRYYPAGFIFDVAGTSIFASTNLERAGLLSFLNSQIALEQLAAVAPTLNYEVGQVASLPVAESVSVEDHTPVQVAVKTSQADEDQSETSWGFQDNPLVHLTSEVSTMS